MLRIIRSKLGQYHPANSIFNPFDTEIIVIAAYTQLFTLVKQLLLLVVQYFLMIIPIILSGSGLFNQPLTFNIATFKNY